MRVCLRRRMCSQLEMCLTFRIASRPNTNCIGEAGSVVLYVARAANCKCQAVVIL
jgi:hypothetical protein